MPLPKLENGSQALRWPETWEDYADFVGSWGLVQPAAIRALALGHYAQQIGGLNLWIISGRRTDAKQAELRAKYNRGDLKHEPAVDSEHLRGRAFDIGTDFSLSAHQWEFVGQVGEALGLRWGGRFSPPDRPHFDLAGSFSPGGG